jgi:hypothetical protein
MTIRAKKARAPARPRAPLGKKQLLVIMDREVIIRRARLLIVSPDSRANLARRQAETPLIALCRFPGPALNERTGVWVC